MQLQTAADQSACHYDFAHRRDGVYSNAVFHLHLWRVMEISSTAQCCEMVARIIF